VTVYGPQEPTVTDELAAQARLDAAVAAGQPWGRALEDLEQTSEAVYRAVVRASAAPAGPAGPEAETGVIEGRVIDDHELLGMQIRQVLGLGSYFGPPPGQEPREPEAEL
jgi:hypothetical protein